MELTYWNYNINIIMEDLSFYNNLRVNMNIHQLDKWVVSNKILTEEISIK